MRNDGKFLWYENVLLNMKRQLIMFPAEHVHVLNIPLFDACYGVQHSVWDIIRFAYKCNVVVTIPEQITGQ